MSSPSIPGLLEKMNSSDKDFRMMALIDLHTELTSTGFRLDERMQHRVVKKMVQLLDDPNSEVQNKAVECLPPLVDKVNVDLVSSIINPLTQHVLSGDEQQRDISVIGLKSVIAHIAPGSLFADSFSKTLIKQLSEALRQDTEDSVLLEILGIIADLLSRFGTSLSSQHSGTLEVLLMQLGHGRPAVRKRSIHAISCLVPHTSDEVFAVLFEHISTKIAATTSGPDALTIVQCIGSVSRHAGLRMVPYLDKIVPHVVSAAGGDDDDELREGCIQAFEAFVVACPGEMSPYLPQVITLALEFLQYDPNYNYDADDDDEMDFSGSDAESEDDFDDDDDDQTWKIRRAAAKFLANSIKSRPDLLENFYTKVSPVLIQQFKEREENVRVEILLTTSTILRQTINIGLQDQTRKKALDSLVAQHTSGIVAFASKMMNDKSIKTRQAMIMLLKNLSTVAREQGLLMDYIGDLVPGITRTITDKSSTANVKIETLELVNILVQSNPPKVFHPHVSVIVPSVLTAVNDSFYKITSEALVVCQLLVAVLRPSTTAPIEPAFQPLAMELFQTVFGRLNALDVDQEVKERSITCIGTILAVIGDSIGQGIEASLPILLARLQNEITSVVTTKTLAMIAESAISIDLRPILNGVVEALAGFLRKKHRSLRVASLTTLGIVIKRYGAEMATDPISSVLLELPALLDASDLQSAQLAINIVTTAISVKKDIVARLSTDISIMTAMIEIATSQVIQGGALDSLLQFLTALAGANDPTITVQQILEAFVAPVYSPATAGAQAGPDASVLTRRAHFTLAKCVAVAGEAGGEDMPTLASKFAADVASPTMSDSVRLLGLRILGEIGKKFDLSALDVVATINNALSSDVEGVRTAASFALGNVAAGNLALYLPQLISNIRQQSDKQYVLLNAMKELILCSTSEGSTAAFEPYIDEVWGLLFQFGQSPEEGTRNVVAECIGKLTVVNPATLLPTLHEKLASDSAFVRGTAVTAFKFTLSSRRIIDPTPLNPLMPSFFKLIGDSDLDVRRMALVAFNSAIHNTPELVRQHLEPVLPLLYGETVVRKDLIRIVEMGPFKQPFDDGLDARKSAFECMHTVLDTCGNILDIPEFIKHIVTGLGDQHDIVMLCHLMLHTIIERFQTGVFSNLSDIIAGLNKNLDTKAKKNDVKQKHEKVETLRKSAARVIAAMSTAAGTALYEPLAVIVAKVRADPLLRSQLEADNTEIESHPMELG